MSTPVKPTGWKVLIKTREAPTKQGSIILADETRDAHKTAAVVCQIIDVGSLAWQDSGKFGQNPEPWAKIGDWIMIGKYGGSKFKVGDEEYRMINDDEVIGIVTEPDNIFFG
jgi:chaperonin GroES